MKLKRLDLWLPKDHPVFDYPARSRTQAAKDLLDIGLRLERIESLLNNNPVPVTQKPEANFNVKKLLKNIDSF